MRVYSAHLLTLLLCTIPLAAQSQQVYRCGSNYSQTPCPGGHAIDDQLSTLHGSTTAAPGQATVYLCQGQGGGEFWSREHCGKHQAVIDRMETVPASLPWAQQVQQAQRQREQARTLTQTANERRRENGTARRTSHTNESSQLTRLARQERKDAQRDAKQASACAAAQNRITQLNAQGREGGSAAAMEKQRNARRKAAADLQRLGC